MPQTILDRAGDNVDEAARKASRATAAVSDAIESGVATAKRVVRQGGQAAEEFIDTTTRTVRRKPVEAVLTSLAVGIVVGVAMGWILKRSTV